MHPSLAAALLLTLCTLARSQAAQPVPCRLYLQPDLLSPAGFAAATNLLVRAAGEGYTGIILASSRTMRADLLPAAYRTHCLAFRELCRQLHLDLVVAVMPIGYSNSLLSRDPNLAEGLPVRNAPFIVRNGVLAPDDPIAFPNGGFDAVEDNDDDTPAFWTLIDQPGRLCTMDTGTVFRGRASLRMQDVALHEPRHRHARVGRTLHLAPFRSYRLSVAVKTRDWTGGDNRIAVLVGARSLCFETPDIRPTQDWRRISVVFNTLDASTVKLILGTWAGNTGTIWWDDVTIEPAGFVNILRRDGTPLTLTDETGHVTYEEGRDIGPVRDPKLGNDPWAGDYTSWHDTPAVRVLPGGRLREGQRVLASYYQPAVIYQGQVSCCLNAPALYDLLRRQVTWVHDTLAPDGYLMSHDEIRTQGWDASCEKTSFTPAQSLADNMRRCIAMIRQLSPDTTLYLWSDMFDPTHNARRSGAYFLVKGDGPWYGSWRSLPPDIVVVNWQFDPKTRRDSLRHFSDLGHRQILAGYYDGDPRMITGWLKDAAGLPGIDSALYTTWQGNYTHTRAFLEAARRQ